MAHYASVVTTISSSSNPSDLLSYKESDVDIILQLSLWHPNKYTSSVAFLSDNNGENEIIETMLTEIHKFICLETRWMVVASIQDVGGHDDHCYDIRKNGIENNNISPTTTTSTTIRHGNSRRNLLRHQAEESLSTSQRKLQDDEEEASVKESSNSNRNYNLNGGNDIIVVLKNPQLMIKDELDGNVTWTLWTLKYSVLEPIISPQLLSAEELYTKIQTTTQAKLNQNIIDEKNNNTGYLLDGIQNTLPGAMLSVIGKELDTFLLAPSGVDDAGAGAGAADVVPTTATTTTFKNDTSTGSLPFATPPSQETSNTNETISSSNVVVVVVDKNFDLESSYFLIILGTLIMLLAILCLTYLLVTLSRKRYMERKKKILEYRKRARPTDIINNLHECPSL